MVIQKVRNYCSLYWFNLLLKTTEYRHERTQGLTLILLASLKTHTHLELYYKDCWSTSSTITSMNNAVKCKEKQNQVMWEVR